MFTIEHEHDFTVVTTLDQGGEYSDVELILDEEDIVIRQFNEELGCYDLINMSFQQFKDIIASMDKGQGAYYAE